MNPDEKIYSQVDMEKAFNAGAEDGVLEDVLESIRPTAKVTLFRASGKYYCEERWRIPTREQIIEHGGAGGDAVIPYAMRYSVDFRRIDDGPVLVQDQEPWGYDHLLMPDGAGNLWADGSGE